MQLLVRSHSEILQASSLVSNPVHVIFERHIGCDAGYTSPPYNASPLLNPSCAHTTFTVLLVKRSSYNGRHLSLWNISTIPVLKTTAPDFLTSRTMWSVIMKHVLHFAIKLYHSFPQDKYTQCPITPSVFTGHRIVHVCAFIYYPVFSKCFYPYVFSILSIGSICQIRSIATFHYPTIRA